jgi:putative protease
VKEVRRDCIIVSSAEVFCNGDGLCFFDEDGRLQGFRVNRAEGNHLYPASMPDIKKGDRLWRSFDQQWERMMSGQTAERRIPVHFLLEETEQGFRLTFYAEDGLQHSEEFASEHQLARTDQSASIREVLSKLGDTVYVCTDVEVRFSQPWFIPRSTLAEWRRKVAPSQPPRREASFSPITMMQACSSPLGEREGGQPLMSCRFCLRHTWGQCHKESEKLKVKSEKSRMANVKWQDPLYLVLSDGRRFRLEFDCKKCEMNLYSS